MQTNDARRAAEEICRIVNHEGLSAIPDTEQATAIIESLLAPLKADNERLTAERDAALRKLARLAAAADHWWRWRDIWSAGAANLEVAWLHETAMRDELRTRHNALADENGRLEARLEAVRQWTGERQRRRMELIDANFLGMALDDEKVELAELQAMFGRYQDAIYPLPDNNQNQEITQ